VPEPGNPQALNRYAYVYNNPVRYTDSNGHIAILATMGIGATVGGIAMGVIYAATTDQFQWSECMAAIGVGIIAGALIGSGIGLIQGAAIAGGGAAIVATSPSLATIAIGAGTGMAASGGGYMVTNRFAGDSFDTTDFLIASGVGAVEGGVSATTGAVGRVLVSGAAGIAGSAMNDWAHGRDVDWRRAAQSGGIGLVAGGVGEAAGSLFSALKGTLDLPESKLGPSIPVLDLRPLAWQQLGSYREITRQATEKAQWQAARHVVRTVKRDILYQAGVDLVESRMVR
ncbi:MAG: hypothetical protein ACPLYD_16075, partial [Anaerolineae bacterium]